MLAIKQKFPSTHRTLKLGGSGAAERYSFSDILLGIFSRVTK